MAWTDQMVEDLRTMWKQGLTTAEIGKRLGVSKNSIVGKVHRLGLSGRPSPIKKKGETAAVKPTEDIKPAKVSTPVEEKKQEPKSEAKSVEKPKMPEKKEPKRECQKSELERNPRALSLMDLDNHSCRWPIGDPKDEGFHFCGKKVKIGQTYCEEHSAIAYVKPGKMK